MADSSRTIMTDAGFALEARIRAGQTKIEFTRASISTADHFKDTDDVLAKLTVLDDVQQDGQVTDVQVIDDTTVHVQIDVDQAESKADYQMRSAALYAKDDDGTEVLYGVTVLQDPVFVHKDADGSYLGFGINTTVGRASNVVVVVDPANMVTQQVFEGTMKNYYTKAEVDAKFVTDDDFASKLPKNIATTDAANTFTGPNSFAQAPTDGDGNPYITNKDAQAKVDAGVKTAASDAATKATAAQTAAEKHADDADKLLVKTADTTDWQKHSITAADGGNKYSFTTATTPDLVAAIQKMPLGYHTFYCQAGVNGNPSTQAIRGVAEITTAGSNPLGVGYVTDSTGAFWSYYIDSSGWKLKRSVDDSTAVHNGDQIGGRNLIVHTGELVGQMVSPDGSIAAFDQSNAMKDTISVIAGEWLTFHQETPNEGVQCFRWAWIDKDGKVISRQSDGSKQIFKVQVPASAVTMRVSYPIIGRVKLERGKVVSDWSDAPEELSGGRNYIQNSESIIIDGDSDHFKAVYNGLTPGGWTISADVNYLAGTDSSVIISVLDQNMSDAKPTMSIPITNGRISQNIYVPDSTHYRLAVYATGVFPDVSGKSPWLTTAGKKLQLTNVMLEKGSAQHDYVPAPEDMVSQTDAANWQKTSITNSDGGNKYSWLKTNCPDLVTAIQSLQLGYHTFYCQAGVKGNPSVGSIRGTIEVTSSSSAGFFAVGSFVDDKSSSWSFFMDNTGWKLSKPTLDNGNNTITVNGKIITPATMDDIQNAINTVKAYVDSKITS